MGKRNSRRRLQRAARDEARRAEASIPLLHRLLVSPWGLRALRMCISALLSALFGLCGGALAEAAVEIFGVGDAARRWWELAGVGVGLGAGAGILEGKPYLPAVLAPPVVLAALVASGVGRDGSVAVAWALSVGMAEYLAPPVTRLSRVPAPRGDE